MSDETKEVVALPTDPILTPEEQAELEGKFKEQLANWKRARDKQYRAVPEYEKKKALQSAIHYMIDGAEEYGVPKQPFYGFLLQQFHMSYNESIPTAGVGYDKVNNRFNIVINPWFFCRQLTFQQRIAVLHHELMHFTNKHLFRLDWHKSNDRDRMIQNIAGDMSINQYIVNLPRGCANCPHTDPNDTTKDECFKCIDVADWKMDDGSPFPTLQTIEHYYELIKSEAEKQKNNKNEKGESQTKGNVGERLGGYREVDVHDWDSLDEATKGKLIGEARELIKRSIEKTEFSHNTVPGGVRDLLTNLDVDSNKLNYRKILRDIIKKTVQGSERENTWKRPNKRYGVYSPGSKIGDLPKLAFFNDSSGSISIKEQNEYLRIMDEFLKVGARNCTLGFWHTVLYYIKPYRKGQEIKANQIESGGTDVGPVLKYIAEHKPNLSIILTDGFFDKVDIEAGSEVLWVISKGGNPDHPNKHIGKTILLDALKDD